MGTTEFKYFETEIGAFAEVILVSAPYVYEARAAKGSATTDPVWQVARWDTTGPIKRQWADGNDSYDNLASNLPSLNYL